MSDLVDRTMGLRKEAATFAKDAAYVAVGFGVLGVHKLRAERVALQARVPQIRLPEERWQDLRTGVGRQARQLDGIVGAALDKVESSLQPLEAQLPAGARQIAGKAHATARHLRNQVSRVLNNVS